MRFLQALIFALFVASFQTTASAQTPVITTEFSEDPVNVGQPFLLRLTVLVPTYMPKPPIFPSFESENMIVRLPERATSPTSKSIDGETWSGITRSYRLYPMVAGVTSIPEQEVTLFYMSPETNEEVTFKGKTTKLSIAATLPKGAQDLDPPIIAQGLTVTQTISPQEGPIKIGESIERDLLIKIDGTSPLFIPPLIGEENIHGLATYPQDPKVSETSNRGVMSGSREERVVYIAQMPSQIVLPDISLSWYNLSSNAVETVTLAGLSTEITQPSAIEKSLGQNLILTLVSIPVLIALLWLIWRRFAHPRLQILRIRFASNYNSTPHATFQRAQKAAKAQNLTSLLAAIDSLDPLDDSIATTLRNLTHAIYGAAPAPKSDMDRLWANVAHSLKRVQPHYPLGAVLGLKRPQTLKVGQGFGNQNLGNKT